MSRRPSQRECADLVGLADGALQGEERRAAETRVAATDWGPGALERQRFAVRAVRSATPPAPTPLRLRIDEAVRAARKRRAALRVRAGLTGLAGALAAATVVLLVVALAPNAERPSIQEVTAIAARGPDLPAPPPREDEPSLLAANAYGVDFPEWEKEFGWAATGERADQVGDRDTRSVFYHHTHHTITYTVVSGPPLELPPGGERKRSAGTELSLYKQGPRDVAVFERGGRTCVVSGAVHHRSTIVELAGWKGDGAVSF